MEADESRRIKQDCRELVIRFAGCMDRGERDKLIALFAPDGTWIRGGRRVVGHEQIRASSKGRRPDELVRHIATNIDISVIDRETAEGVSYYTFYRYDSPGGPVPLPAPLQQPFSMGEWHDKFVLTREGWRIAQRETRRLFEHPFYTYAMQHTAAPQSGA